MKKELKVTVDGEGRKEGRTDIVERVRKMHWKGGYNSDFFIPTTAPRLSS